MMNRSQEIQEYLDNTQTDMEARLSSIGKKLEASKENLVRLFG